MSAAESTRTIAGIPLVDVTRGDTVESVHDVAACAIGRDGAVLVALGDVEARIYLRSCAKPFIAAVAVMAGVCERFGIDDRELAIVAASHNGEPFHIDLVRSVLRKIGLDETALQCGADYPYDTESEDRLRRGGVARAPIYHNCSGKHAGILALSVALGEDPATYMNRDSAVQERILDFCARASGLTTDELNVAVDGCGIPVYAVPLHFGAQAYARLATLEGFTHAERSALRRVRSAMMNFPENMSGTGDFDAELIRAGDGTIVCKSGAEGVHATALIDRGIGIVVKVVDGAERARPPATLAVLDELSALSDGQKRRLEPFYDAPVRNRAGRFVGRVSARRLSA